MYIGGSITLIALGAIARFAVADDLVSGISLDTTGWILMALGFLGLLISLFQTVVVGERRVDVHETVEHR